MNINHLSFFYVYSFHNKIYCIFRSYILSEPVCNYISIISVYLIVELFLLKVYS